MNIVFQLTLPPSTNDDELINVYELYHRAIRDTIQTNVTDIFPDHEVTVLNITSGFIDIECSVGTVASKESFGCGKMIYLHYGIEKIVFALDSIIPFMIKTFLCVCLCFFFCLFVFLFFMYRRRTAYETIVRQLYECRGCIMLSYLQTS